jgi:hypothetical protein
MARPIAFSAKENTSVKAHNYASDKQLSNATMLVLCSMGNKNTVTG